MKKEEKTIVKTFRKSAVRAVSKYDYMKLEYPNEKLLPMTIEEGEETLEVIYEIEGKNPFSEIRKCSRQERLRILLDAAELSQLRKDYDFKILPDNLYFDENYRVYIMDRDVYQRGESDQSDFLEEYKALIGYALQKKYNYQDYYEGGKDLYQKNKFLKSIRALTSLQEVTAALEKEYYGVTEEIRTHKLLVNKKSYRSGKVYIILSIICLLAGAAYISYFSFWEKPVLSAKLQAEINFLKGDYIQTVDNLSELEMKQLGYDQKYILSVSFVHLESLTAEQKSNILSQLPINGDEKLMEYWIHIGRLNPLEAENIAMQKSDDELLLYAYMQEKDLVETDTEMLGDEKAAKLDELNGKIEKLAEKYVTEE